MSLIIRNARVLQTTDDGKAYVLDGQDVFIRGTSIESVGPASAAPRPDADEILEANGQLLMPGLVNCHSHVPMVIFRGLAEDVSLEKWFNEYMWPLESNLQEEDVYWGMMLGLAEMIEAGVTCVADHYFFMDRAAEAVEQAGTRAALGWAVFGSQGLTMLDRTVEFCRRWQGAAGGRITTWLAPHAPYTCGDDFLRAARDRAADLDAGIHIHVAETRHQTEIHLQKRGVTPIRLLEDLGILRRPTLLAHAVGATVDDLRLLADRPAGVAHCPKTYLKLAMGIAPVHAMRHAGIAVGLGTDGAVSNNTLDVWESMRLMALTQKEATGSPENLTLGETLAIATRGSAQVAGLRDQLGAVEPGRLADLILVDLGGAHHQPLHCVPASLVYATRASDVRTVIVNGRILMRDRQLLTLDKTEIIRQVNRSLERLSRRTPESRIQVYRP